MQQFSERNYSDAEKPKYVKPEIIKIDVPYVAAACDFNAASSCDDYGDLNNSGG
ncbi:MAG: hypothetical protein ABIH86_06900 [Planctomycetota bacterium]